MLPADIIREIIKEQSNIIGEKLARDMAFQSGVVKFKSQKIDDIIVEDVGTGVAIEKIVNTYGFLFGKASIDVCISVIRKFPKDSTSDLLPESLKSKINFKS
ncbi:MAG: hypothetical protein ACD_22C00062G0007 [uncultured bacterium]|nr:MAG: hypothetical protein ACD_22C00062G0007 [uncultured bacterium]